MDWDLSWFVSGVSLGRLGAKEVYSEGHGKDVFVLFPGLVRPEYPKGETPQLGATFINQFLKVRGDFPVDFLLIGWVHSTDKHGGVEWLDLFLSSLDSATTCGVISFGEGRTVWPPAEFPQFLWRPSGK